MGSVQAIKQANKLLYDTYDALVIRLACPFMTQKMAEQMLFSSRFPTQSLIGV